MWFRSSDLIKNLALCDHPECLNYSNGWSAKIDLYVMTPDVDKKKSNRGQTELALTWAVGIHYVSKLTGDCISALHHVDFGLPTGDAMQGSCSSMGIISRGKSRHYAFSLVGLWWVTTICCYCAGTGGRRMDIVSVNRIESFVWQTEIEPVNWKTFRQITRRGMIFSVSTQCSRAGLSVSENVCP